MSESVIVSFFMVFVSRFCHKCYKVNKVTGNLLFLGSQDRYCTVVLVQIAETAAGVETVDLHGPNRVPGFDEAHRNTGLLVFRLRTRLDRLRQIESHADDSKSLLSEGEADGAAHAVRGWSSGEERHGRGVRGQRIDVLVLRARPVDRGQ